MDKLGLVSKVRPRGVLTWRVPLATASSSALAIVLALTGGRHSSAPSAFDVRREMREQSIQRLTADLAAVRSSLATAPIGVDRATELRARIDAVEGEIKSIPEPDPASFTTVLPLNRTHAKILGIHGAMLAAHSLAPLVVWKTHRYDAVPFLADPSFSDGAPAIEISVMRGEYRADAILLTNATDQSIEVQVQLSDVPGSPRPDWLRVSTGEWTDTQQHTPVADALPDAPFSNNAYRFAVPGGMTLRIWFTVNGAKLEPGTYQGRLTVQSARSSMRVPATFRVSRVTMALPRLSLGTWDYTDGNGKLGITPQNKDAAIRLMRSHFVDSPWATRAVLPWPKADQFDEVGSLKDPLDFQALDSWIGFWPGARRYYVAIEASSSFAGAPIRTPQFATRLASWGRAVVEHARALGLASKGLGFLLVDEPRREEQNVVISEWARVLRTSAADLDLFEDPIFPRPDQVSPPEAFTLVDELCLHLGIYSRGGSPVARYFEERRAAGQRLWVYQTSGPVRLLDPTQYFRMQAWHAFSIHAIGIAFWSFGDTGGRASSWNEYATGTIAYAPAFIGPFDVTDSVHWQAVREGIEDYEYLSMLSDTAGSTADSGQRAAAMALRREALDELPGSYVREPSWNRNAPVHARPDVYRLRILSFLESIHPR